MSRVSGRFADLIWSHWRDSEAELERRAGLTPKSLRNWRRRDRRQLPPADELQALAHVLDTSTSVLTWAWLVDHGYLVEAETDGFDDVVELLRQLSPPLQQAARENLATLRRLEQRTPAGE